MHAWAVDALVRATAGRLRLSAGAASSLRCPLVQLAPAAAAPQLPWPARRASARAGGPRALRVEGSCPEPAWTPGLGGYRSLGNTPLTVTPPSQLQAVQVSAVADSESLPTRRLNRKGVDDSVFDELGLDEVYGEVGGIRTRQHVNPLKRELQVVMPPPEWGEVFEDPSLPLTVDIGCGPGRFLLMMAKGAGGGSNFLGLEIRAKMVDRAIQWAEQVGLAGCTHFLPANATVSFASILSTYPGPVDLVCIQCPDPHFKKRHHKRRIVQPGLVEAVKGALATGGRVFLQSDVEEVGVAMRDQFERYGSDVLSLHPLHAETGVEYEPIPEGVLTGVAEVQRAAREAARAEGGAAELDEEVNPTPGKP